MAHQALVEDIGALRETHLGQASSWWKKISRRVWLQVPVFFVRGVAKLGSSKATIELPYHVSMDGKASSFRTPPLLRTVPCRSKASRGLDS